MGTVSPVSFSNTPLSATDSSSHANANGTSTKVKRKRNRVPLSCTICRKRKVKCDKIRPHCQQCTKTGVAHLCHYMEQSWAEEAEKELSKETELKMLRDRVKSLEKTLSKIHNSSMKNSNGNDIINTLNDDANNLKLNGNGNSNRNGNSIHLMKNEGGAGTGSVSGRNNLYANNKDNIEEVYTDKTKQPSNDHENDELDLTKQFDMLHIKNNGTIHLGATHWMAIMKGDPYLKLLWAHIFNIRGKINEWYSQKLLASKKKKSGRVGKCPVMHNKANGTAALPPNHPPIHPGGNGGKCPVAHRAGATSATTTAVATPSSLKNSTIATPSSTLLVPTATVASANPSVEGKCPVIHGSTSPSPILSNNTNLDASKCPVVGNNPAIKLENVPFGFQYQSGALSSRSSTDQLNTLYRAPSPSLPSFQNFHSSINPANNTNNTNTSVMNNIIPGLADTKFKKPLPVYPVNVASLSHAQVVSRLTELLPPKRIISLFIDKFFKHIYPVIPIIDELNFRSHINQILSLKPSQNPVDINSSIQLNLPKKLTDYCHLGILIIILRLTWLSLPGNACKIDLGNNIHISDKYLIPNMNVLSVTSSNLKEDNLLMKYETSFEALELVKKYLIKFDEISSISNNNINLTTIQFAIFYKMYTMSCPNNFGNDTYDNETNQILLSSIIQMAFSCGLHRDPDNFPQLNVVSTQTGQQSQSQQNPQQSSSSNDNTMGNSKDNNNINNNNNNNNSSNINNNGNNNPTTNGMNEQFNNTGKESQNSTERFKHTWRKIWYYIIQLDVKQSLSLGTPRLLRNLKDFSDTKLPSSSKIDYVRDIKELIIIKNFTLFWQIDLCIISVLNHVLNISLAKNVRKFELDSLIECLNDLTYGKKNINEVINTLINKGLLSTAEGSINYQDTDEVYGLPSLEDILATPSNSRSASPNLGDNHTTSDEFIDKKFESPHEATTRALFFTKHLTLRMLLYLLNYILFTHYEPMGDEDKFTMQLAKGYAQKTLDFAMDGYRNCLIFFNNVKYSNTTPTIFEYLNIILSPHCLDIANRTLQFIVCLILRAKCGPLTGMKESSILTYSSGNEDSDNELSESKKKKQPVEPQVAELNDDLISNLDIELGDLLVDKLLLRMMLFHKLTKQLSIKYLYATRVAKSTGFFITLLNERQMPTGKNGGWKHPKISDFFKNVPSLVLSTDNDRLKRCPVYQDALGFMVPKSSGGSNSTSKTSQFVASRLGRTQLPPLRTYQPITFTSSDGRQRNRADDGDDTYQKRRKIAASPGDQNGLSAFAPSPLPPLPNIGGGVAPAGDVFQNLNSLPPLDKLTTQTQLLMQDMQPSQNSGLPNGINGNNNVNNGAGTNNNTNFSDNSINSFTTPESDLTNTPDFEDFLMQNSNMNGLFINPSSLVEAMTEITTTTNATNPTGRDDLMGNVNSIISGNNSLINGDNNSTTGAAPVGYVNTFDNLDFFLPFDNGGIDDINNGSEFAIWD
ncbi:hypothetical protein NCAS_0A08840 [Naumovozyma castellii]|uniref:Zn(2)-C6 fungal-type domain-containing protein n=1 Tax=Naumovozyma castellii TaxID=27288 RepID=G0V7J4_NAUCA|nr:hypothetical protein NCAS_0A08840 [Naumovozyma castellii CBS 4309]CCC67442.1 hypothetical protein NCAS_0A08840 [Naumovozyma castellii CBS 4309]